ncbi:hypothetical protein EMIT0158MI4_100317 [Burkholderia ambifaria]
MIYTPRGRIFRSSPGVFFMTLTHLRIQGLCALSHIQISDWLTTSREISVKADRFLDRLIDSSKSSS